MNQKETSAPGNNQSILKNKSLRDKIEVTTAALGLVVSLVGLGYFTMEKMARDKIRARAQKPQQEIMKAQGDQEYAPVKEKNDSIPMGESGK